MELEITKRKFNIFVTLEARQKGHAQNNYAFSLALKSISVSRVSKM